MTEAFETVDQVHEGESLFSVRRTCGFYSHNVRAGGQISISTFVTHPTDNRTSFWFCPYVFSPFCFLCFRRRASNRWPGAFLHGDPEHAGRSCR